MKIIRLIFLIISVLTITSDCSLINDFFAGAKNLWPKPKDISSTSQLNDLPSLQFEFPKENDAFLKEGLELINAPKETFDLCTHQVILSLKKNCNTLSSEEIGKLAIMLMNCQLRTEGRSIYPCTPEMTLAQCTMGFDNSIYQLYNILTNRALSICSAIKQQQYRMFTEIAVNRLMHAAQKQALTIHDALQNQKRINEMGIQNIQEYKENFDKIKETQELNMDFLVNAKEQISELNTDLHRQLEIHQQSEQKLIKIERSADEIARQLESTNVKIVQHYNEALAFLEHFKNIMQMIAVVMTTIEQVFGKIKEIMNEIGIELTYEMAITLIFNLIYFTCGMIFIIFVNLQQKYKKVLIFMFMFNCLAAFYQSQIHLLATNIFVWLSLIGYYLAQKIKAKLFSQNFKLLGFMRLNNDDDDEESNSGDKSRSVSRARSKTPFSKPPPSKKVSEKVPSNKNTEEEDAELADLCEREMIKIQKNIPQTSNVILVQRPDTPNNRPMTPTIARVMRTDGVDVNRAGTPFSPAMSGRIQCQAFTKLGAQCRNAALIGYAKCKVHNYD
ncbi:protein brambleberry-like [Chironomus tepperi]|uniref:protein brambleberry-like n=1 Tax=Chironomus tepperi TaxID=113505 RepID=UPI00391F75CB